MATGTIKIRRGLKAVIPTLNDGELGFCTDTKEVYIGDGSANYKVGGMTEAEFFAALVQEQNNNTGELAFYNEVDYDTYGFHDKFSLVRLDGSAAGHVGMGTFTSINPVTGVMMQVTRAGQYHTYYSSTHAKGACHVRTSGDLGKTWSAWVNLTPSSGGHIINTISYDFRNHWGGHVTKGVHRGRFMLFYEDYNGATGVRTTYYSYTDDDGATWNNATVPFPANVSVLVNIGKNNVLEWQEEGVDYIGVPFYALQVDGGVNTWLFGLLVSNNEGDSFEQYRYAESPGATTYPSEPTILQLADGVFLMVCRDAFTTTPHTGGLMQYISYDYGNTWIYQGYCSFETQTISNSANQLLPSMGWVNCYGRRLICLTWTNRNTGKLKRIFAAPENLMGPLGHEGWNIETMEEIHSWTSTYQNMGNGSTCFPFESPDGLYTGEDHTSQSNAYLDGVKDSIDIDLLAHHFNTRKTGAPVMWGIGAPRQAPRRISQWYVDMAEQHAYVSVGTASADDWKKLVKESDLTLVNGNSLINPGGDLNTTQITFGRLINTATSNFAAADSGTWINCDFATAQTLTIPTQTLIPWKPITILPLGAGQVTIQVANGANQWVNTECKTPGQYKPITLMCISITPGAEKHIVIGGVA